MLLGNVKIRLFIMSFGNNSIELVDICFVTSGNLTGRRKAALDNNLRAMMIRVQAHREVVLVARPAA